MNIRWKDVYPNVATLLKDDIPENSNRKPRYEPDDVREWWNNAQVRLATMRPVRKFQQYRADDGDVVSLPNLFYKPIGVFPYGSNESLPRIKIDSEMFTGKKHGYYIYEGKLCLTLPSQPEAWVLLYYAYYPRVLDEDSRVYVPDWALEACSIYVAIQATTREMMADAKYRKFTSPEDAGGNPTHNPYVPVARWLKERFYEVVATHVDDDEDAYG